MGDKLTFSQWQSSRGITPWVFKPQHIRFGMEEMTKAVNSLYSLWPQIQETMTSIARKFNAFAQAYNKEA